MKTVQVTASRNYEVRIGSGLLSDIGACASSLKAQKVCVVSDSHVWPIYGEQTENNLLKEGLTVSRYVIQAGETSKNGENLLSLLNHLAEQELTRADLIVALGGGVVGDLAGFAASVYLRGIRYIQVPTTLLAAVDSSVGGKTAIDLPAGKNLAGAFWQPSLVLCDTNTLSTLPRDIFLDGCAEVIKYAVLYDPELFTYLESTGPDFDLEKVISRCVKLKRDVVAQDEFDNGYRMKLNLGHTIGHGVEACSNFTISHGKAVAIGIAIVSRASECVDADRIIRCMERFELPVHTEFSAEDLYSHTLNDKKRHLGSINLIIPNAIGDCSIVTTGVESILPFIKAGL